MPSALTRVLSAACCALVVTACGSGRTTSAQTRAALQDRVGTLVSAVNAQDYPTARTALAALRADVEDAQRLGGLTDTRAVELTRLADGVQAALPPAPAPVATRAPASTPASPPTASPVAPAAPVVRPTPTRAPAEPAKRKERGKDEGDKHD